MNSLCIIDACMKEHFAAMSRIHARGWHTVYLGRVPDDHLRGVITEDHWVPFFQEDHATGRYRGLLLYDGENPVCCCTCGPVRLGPGSRQSEGLVIHEETYRGWGEITFFYIGPACTGRGHDLVPMEEALRRLRADGYLNCCVFVLRENEGAHRFYAWHGFTWDRTEEHIPFPHDITCVDLRYTRRL